MYIWTDEGRSPQTPANDSKSISFIKARSVSYPRGFPYHSYKKYRTPICSSRKLHKYFMVANRTTVFIKNYERFMKVIPKSEMFFKSFLILINKAVNTHEIFTMIIKFSFVANV